MVKEETKCPRCGLKARREVTSNPIRNVMREHILCGNCGFESVKEYAP